MAFKLPKFLVLPTIKRVVGDLLRVHKGVIGDKVDLADKALDLVILRLPFPANLIVGLIEDELVKLIKREIDEHIK